MRVSHHWASAEVGMRGAGVAAPRVRSWAQMFSSRFARHIASLGGADSPNGLAVKLDQALLREIARRMHKITTLHCCIILPPRGVLPPGSQFFSLEAERATDLARVQAALEALCGLRSLKVLSIRIPQAVPGLSLAALREALPHLEEFGLHVTEGFGRDRLSPGQIDDIRAMTNLRVVSFKDSIAADLPRLLKSPHELQWKEIRLGSGEGLPHALDKETCERLATLPSLTALSGFGLSASAPALFAEGHLPNLTRLSLSLFQAAPAASPATMARALQSCTRLVTLTLQSCEFNSAQMCKLLP
jgi:hypothetical protein